MPEDIEVPTEQLHETLKENAERAEVPWLGKAALSAALIAVAAAIGSLLAGHHANEAMLEQMQANDQWAYFQAKGIKAALIESKLQILASLEKPAPAGEEARAAQYEADQKKIEENGHELEASSKAHMEHHTVLARSVTVFQIAIALAAIAVLMRRRAVWITSMVLGLLGTFFLVQGLR